MRFRSIFFIILEISEHHVSIRDIKLSFNPLKSSCYSINSVDYEFLMNGSCVLKSEGFFYLGLPVGKEAFVENFYNEKMSKCEKAL